MCLKVFIILWSLVIIFQLCSARSTTPRTVQSQEEMIRETCLEITGYKPLDNNTYFRVMEVVESSSVSLPCSFCGENNQDSARIWLKKPRSADATAQEVELGMSPILVENRLFTFPNHSLTLHNVTMNDTGVYYCRGSSEDDDLEFQFSLDLVKSQIPVVEEKTTPWSKYMIDHIENVNKRIYESKGTDMEELLDMVKVRVSSEWDPWLPCDGCANIRRRYAKCRLHSQLNRVKYPDIRVENLKYYQKLLYQSVVISCHSQDLAKWFPHLYSLTEIVPNLLEVHSCYSSCVAPESQAFENRNRIDLKMEVGSSMSFVCPNSDLERKVVWKKNGLTMSPVGYIQPKEKKKSKFNFVHKKNNPFKLNHAFVDRLNVLQLCLVTDQETAVFVCYIGNKVIKSFHITVVATNEEIQLRHYYFWLLSLYTSLLSAVVVFAGVLHGLFTRNQFITLTDDSVPVTPDEINIEENNQN